MTIVFDVVIFFLPIPVLWTVQINRRRKAALSGVFLLGLFTTVCSILRMARIPALAVDGNSTLLVLWGTIEVNVGVRNLASNSPLEFSHQLTNEHQDFINLRPGARTAAHVLLRDNLSTSQLKSSQPF